MSATRSTTSTIASSGGLGREEMTAVARPRGHAAGSPPPNTGRFGPNRVPVVPVVPGEWIASGPGHEFMNRGRIFGRSPTEAQPRLVVQWKAPEFPQPPP